MSWKRYLKKGWKVTKKMVKAYATSEKGKESISKLLSTLHFLAQGYIAMSKKKK